VLAEEVRPVNFPGTKLFVRSGYNICRMTRTGHYTKHLFAGHISETKISTYSCVNDHIKLTDIIRKDFLWKALRQMVGLAWILLSLDSLPRQCKPFTHGRSLILEFEGLGERGSANL
jgi:hypothetical protein